MGHLPSKAHKRSHFIASFLYLGYLALTKILFGWVLVVCLLIFLLLTFFRRRFLKLFGTKGHPALAVAVPIYASAIIICIPYLIYTHSLTGKFFYWGNSGGLSLYWMSDLNKNELGDCHAPGQETSDMPQFKEHKDFLVKMMKLPGVQRDDEFRKQAIQNIKSNPKKYFLNWLANIGRMFFSYPYSYTEQKLSTYLYIIPNMFLMVVFLFCIYPAFVNRRSIPFEIYNFIIFGAVTFFGSSLLSAYPRQLFPIIPILILFIAYVTTNFLKIQLRR